jgi:hypothetical protein
MRNLKFEKSGYKIIDPDIPRKKKLTEEQLRNMFKRVYGKEPTGNEYLQFKLYHQGNI